MDSILTIFNFEIYFPIIIGYISGSVPYGILVTYFFGFGDIRNLGSGNIGATNVLRTGNKKIAIIVLFLDFFKSFFPTIVFSYYFDVHSAILCGSLSILGHMFPVWIKFKGGKGIASLFGFILAINPIFFIILLTIWLIIAIITKFSSLSSIITTISMLFLFLLYDNNTNIVIPLTITILIIIKHKKNIERLFKGKESKIKLL